MHELGLTHEIVEICCERAKGHRVRRVVLEVGKLAAVVPDSIRFCFELCTESTLLEGASLDIVEIPGRARCKACNGELELDRPFGRCACGCSDLDWLSGEELRILEMEVA